MDYVTRLVYVAWQWCDSMFPLDDSSYRINFNPDKKNKIQYHS